MSELQTFYFTFGFGQPFENCFVKIEAPDWETARKEMIRRHGLVWAFQYRDDTWFNKDGVSQQVEYNLREVD